MELFGVAVRRLMEMEAVDFHGIFAGLGRTEKRLAKALASEPTDKPYAKAYLARHQFSAGDTQKALKSLLDKDIAEESPDRTYRLTDPLFARWREEA